MHYWLIFYSAIIYYLIIVKASEDFVLSPGTGQEVPYRLISPFTRAAFSSKTVDVSTPDLVYELVKNDVLVGMGLNVSLQELTLPMYNNLSITYVSNGKRHGRPPTDVYMRQGGGYTVVHEKSSGSVLNIWGNEIYLRALDGSRFPGVFINTHESLVLQSTDSKKPKTTKLGQRKLGVRDEEKLSAKQTERCNSGQKRLVELAIAYDNAFCSLHSNSELIASAYVQAAVNEADVIFKRDTCVSLSLSHIEAHCNDPQDPYTALSAFDTTSTTPPSSQILEKFTSIWRQSRKEVHRDLAYFFSGFQDGTNIVGMAYVASTCLNSGYGWVEKGDISTFVHEVGHSLSASHTNEGVMKATSTHGDPVFFSDDSIAQITKFVDSYGSNGTPDSSRDSRCLEESSSVCDATCPGRCANGQCIALHTETVSEGLVPCTPVRLIYRCTKLHESKFMLGSDCPSGFDFVLRADSDLDVFCCLSPKESISAEVITHEYPFVDLNLNSPDGPQTYPEYIQDPSLVSNQTLIRSKLVPSCKLPSAKNPSKSPAPNVSPVFRPRPPRTPTTCSSVTPLAPSSTTPKPPSSIPSPIASPTVLPSFPSFSSPSVSCKTSSSPAPSVLPSVSASEAPEISITGVYSTHPLPVTPSQSTNLSPWSSADASQTPRISKRPFFFPFPSIPYFPGITGIASLGTVGLTPSSKPPAVPPLNEVSAEPSSISQLDTASTCSDAFATGQTFKCVARIVLRTKASIRLASIRLQVIQRYGLFTLKVKVGHRIRIHSMAAHISTINEKAEGNLGPITNFDPNGVSEAIVSIDPFALKVPDGMTTCCGQRLFVHASLGICSASDKSVCASTGVLSADTVMRCMRACRKKETVTPFSTSLACPKCVSS